MNASNYDQQRELMVQAQLVARGISDKKVLNAMRKVPRHVFLPKEIENLAYDDCALPIGDEQTISQPYMVALMTELLELKGGETVLEIGTGSGYQAVILAEIAKQVYTIERIPSVAKRAQSIVNQLGYKNIEIIVADGTEGSKTNAPFDGIIVTAASPEIPKTLTDQLAESGRLVIPVGDRYLQKLMVITKEKGELITEESIGCVFVPLIGKFGWGN